MTYTNATTLVEFLRARLRWPRPSPVPMEPSAPRESRPYGGGVVTVYAASWCSDCGQPTRYTLRPAEAAPRPSCRNVAHWRPAEVTA